MTEKDERGEEEEEEEEERKWATGEIHIWRHYKKDAEMLRAANTEGRVRDFALSCESARNKGGGPRDEKEKQSEGERESGSDFMESWKQRSGGWASERARGEGREGGREEGAGLVSSRSQSEAGVVLCRVNLTLATQ